MKVREFLIFGYKAAIRLVCPVSYTHLDVYKRQDFPHDKILGAVFFGKQGAAVFVISLVFVFYHRQLPP